MLLCFRLFWAKFVMPFSHPTRCKMNYLVAVGGLLPGCGGAACGRVVGMTKGGKGHSGINVHRAPLPNILPRAASDFHSFLESRAEFEYDPLLFEPPPATSTFVKTLVLRSDGELVNGRAVD